MQIAIDLRSIQRGLVSGVETYAHHITEKLLNIDRQNNYTLFYNAIGGVQSPELKFVNARIVHRRWPNKLIALATQANFPKLDMLAQEPDVLWLPNLNHAAVSNKVKLVLTVHDCSPFTRPEFYDAKRRIWHASVHFAKLLSRADKLIAVSEYTKHDLVQKFGVPAGKISVIPEGVNSRVYRSDLDVEKLRRIRNLYALPGEYILYLGTLEPRKNVAGLIHAFGKMQTGASLVIAGRPGWKFKEIFDAAKQSRKRKHIHFLGFIPEGDKPYLMKLARVFAFPSFYEGFGLPVLEAAACGTPVVTSSVTSLPEVMDDAALLANPYNLDELRFALEQVVNDDNLHKELSMSGLTRAQQFTWENAARETLKVLVG